MSLDDLFGRVVVINLDRDTDKWRTVRAEMERVGVRRYERLSATDGGSLTEEDKEGLATPACRRHCTDSMIGCADSHRRAWQACVDGGLPSLLVLEDDVVFDDGVAESARSAVGELPDDWSVLCLGCFTCHEGVVSRSEPYSEHLVRPRMVAGTHAYAVSRRGARQLLRAIPRAETHIDWSMTRHIGALQAFALASNSAFQRDMDQSNIVGKAPAALNLVLGQVRIGSEPLDGRTLGWILSENFSRVGWGRAGMNVNAWVTGVFTLGMLASLAPGVRGLGALVLAIAADAACAVVVEPAARCRKVAEEYAALVTAAAAGWGAGRATARALRSGRAQAAFPVPQTAGPA